MNYDPNNNLVYNGSNWISTPSTSIGAIPNTINPWNHINTINTADFVQSDISLKQTELNYINSVLQEYFDEFNVDIEEVTMKEIFDFIVKKDALLIEFVPQTVERCKLALSTEWSKKVKDAIQLPFTGELHKFYLKMKLTYGPLK